MSHRGEMFDGFQKTDFIPRRTESSDGPSCRRKWKSVALAHQPWNSEETASPESSRAGLVSESCLDQVRVRFHPVRPFAFATTAPAFFLGSPWHGCGRKARRVPQGRESLCASSGGSAVSPVYGHADDVRPGECSSAGPMLRGLVLRLGKYDPFLPAES